ncbi:MAG: PTS sugar transporter subunit IIC, partial [bacterium]|nr:PTS sugar transporter subunit IIC [bacterium]
GNALGGPVGALLATIVGTELGKLVSKETRIDILVTPGVTIISGVLIAQFVGPGVSAFMNAFGTLVKSATEMQPFLMGILVSVLIGVALTLPISSAAICIMLGLDGIAGGAATAGCCAQMIGFAILSFRENGWGGLAAQGLGTSMLQMGNIVKNPKIWIAPTLASAVTGPIATMVFHLENIAAGSGMGTCGLVGPIGIYTAMNGGTSMWLGILLVCFVLPAILTWLFGIPLRRMGWIKDGDLKLNL